jgi:hypothetical protein
MPTAEFRGAVEGYDTEPRGARKQLDARRPERRRLRGDIGLPARRVRRCAIDVIAVDGELIIATSFFSDSRSGDIARSAPAYRARRAITIDTLYRPEAA